ncbi:hypothetical protein [Kribbella sp. NPDC023855]|uniref:hypothetical protein n=1 Tax=Kribbella sp. NPDC023855 TaxID=3154698 RepID=UPI0033C67071
MINRGFMKAAAAAAAAIRARDAQNALPAAACGGLELRRWRKTVPSSATPTVPPSCWTALSRPTAEPVSAGRTRCSAAMKKDVVNTPAPTPLIPTADSSQPIMLAW